MKSFTNLPLGICWSWGWRSEASIFRLCLFSKVSPFPGWWDFLFRPPKIWLGSRLVKFWHQRPGALERMPNWPLQQLGLVGYPLDTELSARVLQPMTMRPLQRLASLCQERYSVQWSSFPVHHPKMRLFFKYEALQQYKSLSRVAVPAHLCTAAGILSLTHSLESHLSSWSWGCCSGLNPSAAAVGHILIFSLEYSSNLSFHLLVYFS